MSIRLSVSLLLVLLVAQVSCRLIKVEKIEQPDTERDKVFREVLEKRIAEAQDQKKKDKLQQEIAANPGFITRGVQVSFGNNVGSSATEWTSYPASMMTCLEENQYIKLYPAASANKIYETKFHISFDFGEYTPVDLYSQPASGVNNGQLCFLYGYSYP